MNDEQTKEEMGVPPGLVFGLLNDTVLMEFVNNGDQYAFPCSCSITLLTNGFLREQHPADIPLI